MHRSYHQWHSAALDRQMEFLVFGHSGPICLVFPTSQGRFYDYENFGMVGVLSDWIESGQLQLICLDSVDAESWFNYHADTALRLWRHDQYEHYIITEVLPFARAQNPATFVIATGCSFGATHAVIFAFRHPDLVNRIVGLSGLYDIKRFFGTYTDAVYYHNPVDFLPNLTDTKLLGQMRQMEIVLAIGQDDTAAWSNDCLSQILREKEIEHALRIWNGWAHEWSYWQQMIRLYIHGPD